VLTELWNTLRDYFKDKPYWPSVQWLFTLVSLFLTASILGYQYLRWEYGFESELSLYLHSYLFRQISVVAATIAVAGGLASLIGRKKAPGEQRPLVKAVRERGIAVGRRVALVGLVACAAVAAIISIAPHRANDIDIVFLDDPQPDFDQATFVYLIYALNQRQRQWYFHVAFDVFNRKSLTTDELQECEGELAALCYAEKAAAGRPSSTAGRPLIAITTHSLGEAHFWQARASTAVITTADWKRYAPPSMYEYLTYLLLVQSIAMHLNTQCSGLPDSAFMESRTAFGDALASTPSRYAMKAEVLAAHLLPRQKELLLNCFGADYLNSATTLLSMDWLRSGTVVETLERDFGVRLSPAKVR
jgi:hypothetical protein